MRQKESWPTMDGSDDSDEPSCGVECLGWAVCYLGMLPGNLRARVRWRVLARDRRAIDLIRVSRNLSGARANNLNSKSQGLARFRSGTRVIQPVRL